MHHLHFINHISFAFITPPPNPASATSAQLATFSAINLFSPLPSPLPPLAYSSSQDVLPMDFTCEESETIDFTVITLIKPACKKQFNIRAIIEV